MRHIITIGSGLLLVFFSGLACEHAPPAEEPPEEGAQLRTTGEPALYYVRPTSVADMLEILDWFMVENGTLRVPNVALLSIPDGLDRMPVEVKKRIFFRALLPLVLYENSRLERDRDRLVRLLDPTGLVAPSTEQEWLSDLMRAYKIQRRPARKPIILEEMLLPRVDIIPASLVLAQAAIESGYGTSRFARSGNAIFGQWTYDTSDSGMVPAKRDSGATHRVKSFRSILASLRAYMRNLNTHPAYQDFRELRAAQRQIGEPLNPHALAETLTPYSARGRAYIDDLLEVLGERELARCSRAELYSVGLDFLTRYDIAELEYPWGTIVEW